MILVLEKNHLCSKLNILPESKYAITQENARKFYINLSFSLLIFLDLYIELRFRAKWKQLGGQNVFFAREIGAIPRNEACVSCGVRSKADSSVLLGRSKFCPYQSSTRPTLAQNAQKELFNFCFLISVCAKREIKRKNIFNLIWIKSK